MSTSNIDLYVIGLVIMNCINVIQQLSLPVVVRSRTSRTSRTIGRNLNLGRTLYVKISLPNFVECSFAVYK